MSANDDDRAAAEAGGPGVMIARRRMLLVPVALAGGALLRGASRAVGQEAAMPAPAKQEPARSHGESGSFAPLTREELGARWRALAAELETLDAGHDESFAAQVSGLLARLPLAALPASGKARPASGLAGGPAWRLLPCMAIEFEMAPGAEIRLHNHPPQIVVSLCAAGEVRARHFEVHGEAPPCTRIDGTRFVVRETRSLLLRPGQSTSFTRRRDGMHGFVAGPGGARLLDFATFLSDDGSTFSYVELSDEPLDEELALWEAMWVGKQ